MAVPQQFSLRWNNYSQHIVNALEDLRSDDELTDVTLSCEGQRIRGHKVLLSACSTFFRETFKENPCKHPVVIIKGVSFLDLEAVVTFMYNGQVNVSQDRLPTFLAAAELLQIKGLTDMNEKEEPKKRPLPGLNHALSHSASRSGTPDNVQRPTSPKRKRLGMDNYSDGSSTSILNKQLQSGSSTNSSSGVGLNSQDNGNGPTITGAGSLSNNNSDHDPFQPDVSIKYEDQDDEEYEDKVGGMSGEDNENSMNDDMMEGSFMGGGGTGTSGNDSSHDEFGGGAGNSPVRFGHLFDDYGGFGSDDVDHLLRIPSATSGGESWTGSPMTGDSPSSTPPVPPSFLSTVPDSFPFTCPYPGCGKIYKCMSSYSEHKRFHLGYFKCVFCSKQLSKKTHLNRHLKNVHHVTLQSSYNNSQQAKTTTMTESPSVDISTTQ